MKIMHRPSASTSLAAGTRNFDLVSFDLPETGRCNDAVDADATVAAMHPYSSDAGLRLFERMMDGFEDRFFGLAL